MLARRKDRDLYTALKRSTAKLFYRLHNWLSQGADTGKCRETFASWTNRSFKPSTSCRNGNAS